MSVVSGTAGIEHAVLPMQVQRVSRNNSDGVSDSITVEQPLEIQMEYGPDHNRVVRPISVTMRTPGHDAELALGFLYTEGVLPHDVHPEDLCVSAPEPFGVAWGPDGALHGGGSIRIAVPDTFQIRTGSLERNFYATSSCGVCGKASLLALRSVAPPRRGNQMHVRRNDIFTLPEQMRAGQGTFRRTGGLHGAALFGEDCGLRLLREDVGRHNAVDKLVGASLLADTLPLRQHILLLSGRVSFELMQKAVMAGIACVVAIGAPSSLAVEVAQAFDVTLIAFLRDDHFNVYHGASRVLQN